MAVELENSSLYREVKNIINGPVKPVHFSWRATLYVGKKQIAIMKVLSIDLLQDYENNYSDELMVVLAISGGTYAKDIYPFKDQIDVVLTKTPIGEISTNINDDSIIQTERYTATIEDMGNPIVEGNSSNVPTRSALDLTTIYEVSFQLVNKSLEQMRMMSVGGIYRNTTSADVMRCVLTNEMKKIVVDGKRMPIGVDIVIGFNTAKRDHVIIPHGTKLVDLPEYIHKKCGGIYSTGFNYYLQKNHWFIYPCYDTTRFNKTAKTVTIINVPRNKFTGIERTYRQDGNHAFILATGQVTYRDDSEVQQLNFGNGVRFSAAENFMTKFSKTVDNKTTVNRGSNNTEVIATDRINGNNNIHISDNAINSNPFVEYSKLARRQGSIISLVWENSQPTLITPGTVVKILYLNDDAIGIVYGVVLKAHHYTHIKGHGMTDGSYVSNTSLFIFIQQIKK